MIESAVLDSASADATTPVIRVAGVPSQHAYVQHIAPETPLDAVPSIRRLADPDPDDWTRAAGPVWWPPVMLEPDWVRANAAFDLLHLQFGFDTSTPAQLSETIAELQASGRPLVYTVHDLRNPHHRTREQHDAQLDVLVPAADALLTLTPGAAAEIRQRWGREAVVIPHPHVVDFPTMERLATEPRADGPFRIGLHVKSLRANMAPLPVLRALVDELAGRDDVVLQVNGHRQVLEPGGDGYDAELAAFLHAAADAGTLELHVHDYLDDAALWRYLAALDASVLPYRFGTHSGWLEACRDVGTAVIAPDFGHYRDQGPVFSYAADEDGVDAASLASAVCAAVAAGAPAPLTVAERRAQREEIAAAHARVYGELVA